MKRKLSFKRLPSRNLLGTSTDVRSHLLVRKINSNGLLYLKGTDEPRIILEASGINFELRGDEEQDALIDLLGQMMSSLNFPIQILVRSRLLDPEEYFETLESWRKRWPEEKRELREQLLGEYKNKISSITERFQIKDRRFYIVVPADRTRSSESAREEEFQAQLRNKESHLRQTLGRAGIRLRRMSSSEIEEIYYYFFDPQMAQIQKMRAASAPSSNIIVEPLSKEDVVTADLRTEGIRQMLVPAIGEITPDRIVFRNTGEVFLNTIYIQHYPLETRGNWLSEVLNLDYNMAVSMHIEPISADRTQKSLDLTERRVSQPLETDEIHEKGKIHEYIEKRSAIGDTREALQRKEKLFFISLYITTYAQSQVELEQANRAVEVQLGAMRFRSQRAHYRQEAAFNSVLPQAVDLLQQKHSILTDALAASFPFNAGSRLDPEGYLFGMTGMEGTVRTIQVLNPRAWENPHILLLGISGGGKSQNAKEKLLEEWIAGSSVVVIDFHGEYEALTRHCGGQVIPIHVGSKASINIWDLGRVPGDENPVQSKTRQLVEFWKLALGSLPKEEADLLDGAINYTYEKAGIFATRAETWDEPSPVTSDFQKAVTERYGADEHRRLEAQSLARRLELFTEGSLASLFNHRTNVNLANDFLTFDFKELGKSGDEELLTLAHWLTLNLAKNRMTGQLQRRVILMDEFWKLARRKEGRDFIFEAARTARRFNTQLILITQSVGEMVNTEEALAGLANIGTTILHKQSMEHLKRLQQHLDLTEAEISRLHNAGLGECLVMTPNHENLFMQTVDYLPEHAIYCTQPWNCGHPDLHPSPNGQAAIDGQLTEIKPAKQTPVG